MHCAQHLCSVHMNVELRHLRAFAAIAQEGSVTAAAHVLGVTQPALSRTLSSLENHLGVRLFDRSTRAVVLSVHGQALLPRVLIALAAVDDVLDAAVTWPLRVGHAWSGAGPYTSQILQEWARARPDVPATVRRVDDRLAGLTRGLSDVAFLRGRVTDPGLHSEPLYSEPRTAVLPTTHPLAGRPALDLADLAGDALVVNDVTGTASPALWPAGGPRPRVALRVGTVEDWLIAIAAGQGVGVTAASTAQLHARPGVVFVPLPDAPPMPVAVAWRIGAGHPARADFARTAQDVVRRLSP